MENNTRINRRINLNLKNIDPELLKKQKLVLINTIFKMKQNAKNATMVDIELKDDLDALTGILHLMDKITDKIDNDEYVITEMFKSN